MNVQPPISSSRSKSGKSTTQWKTSSARVDQVELAARARSRSRPSTFSTTSCSSATKNAVDPSATPNAASSRLREELRDLRSASRAPSRPTPSRSSSSRVVLGARERLRDDDVAHARRVLEDAELRAARHLGRVLDLHPEAEVRLVGAVAEHRLVVGDVRERPRRRLAPTASNAPTTPPPSRRAPPRCSTNAISRSSWRNSNCRSARRSSSRQHVAIW